MNHNQNDGLLKMIRRTDPMIPETEVSRWLSGTHNLTMATICKISAALDAEVVKVADYELEPVYA